MFFHLVPDGVYDRGGRRDNRREAEVIAGLVFDQLARDATKTVGIIAFSQAQMLAIEDQLEKRRRADARYEDYFRDDLTEPIFVRNLETVQGDERDVIFLSLGYGKDSTGKPLLNFGPVNKPGGEKRLNVAITRAREKLVLISSLTSADLQSKHSNSEGMRQLRRYLTFAETNREPKATSLQSGLLKLPTAMPAHPLVVDIRREIKQMGWMATSDFAIDSRQIDLAVSDRKKPEVLLLGILLDGTSYRDASTATDRYRLRPRVLGELGWKLHRVHVLDWIRNRAGEIERMRKMLEGLRGGGRRKG